MNIKELIRENIRNMQPYSCARNEFQGDASYIWIAMKIRITLLSIATPTRFKRKLKKEISRLKNTR
jgi:histidinol-phosphate aminotransferase